MTPGPPNHNATSYTYLLEGPLDDFPFYSRGERSQWLIDMAHDICDPSQKRGSLQVQEDAAWRDVNPTESLTGSTYRYHTQHTVSLTKISMQQGRSRTTTGGIASTMGSCVMQRDGQCWVTNILNPIKNSHVCPKRMGDHLLHIICHNFIPYPIPSLQSIYDERCGISLTPTLEYWFNTYEFGLRFVAMVQSLSFLIFYS